MKGKEVKKGYGPLMGLTIILTLAAIGTAIPAAAASKVSLAQYKALCSFTPISTVLCLLGAAVVCKIRKNKFVVSEAG